MSDRMDEAQQDAEERREVATFLERPIIELLRGMPVNGTRKWSLLDEDGVTQVVVTVTVGPDAAGRLAQRLEELLGTSEMVLS